MTTVEDTDTGLPVTWGNANQITFGTSTNAGGVTITASSGGVLSFWGNQAPGAAANAQQTMIGIGSQMNGSLLFFELDPINNDFPGFMTASTVLLNLSGAAQSVSGFTYSVQLGIYTISASSTLNLLNSVQTSFGYTGNSNSVSTFLGGPRFLTIHSSQWSAQPTFSQTQYVMGLNVLSSSNSIQLSLLGQSVYSSGQRSGTIGVSQTTNVSMGQDPFFGQVTVSTNALPASININALQRTGGSAFFVPHLMFMNLVSAF